MNKHVEYGLVGGIEDWCFEHLNNYVCLFIIFLHSIKNFVIIMV